VPLELHAANHRLAAGAYFLPPPVIGAAGLPAAFVASAFFGVAASAVVRVSFFVVFRAIDTSPHGPADISTSIDAVDSAAATKPSSTSGLSTEINALQALELLTQDTSAPGSP